MSNYPDGMDSTTVLPGEDCEEVPDVKPCPFCGWAEPCLTRGPSTGDFFAVCPKCYATGPSNPLPTHARDAWNQRVNE